jgi:Xaa-Pro aminopeptidase
VTLGLPESSVLAARHLRVRRAIEALGLEALIVTTPANLRYLANHVGTAGTLLVTPGDIHLLIDFRYKEAVRALQESPAACPGLRIWDVPDSYDEALASAVMSLGTSVVGIEAAHLTVARQEWLARTWTTRGAAVTLRSTERTIEQFRLVKDAAEITVMREAAARLTGVADAAFAAVRPGIAERDVAAAIEAALRKAGYERPAFDTIVASGPNAALPHYRAGDRTLHTGDLVVLDFGGVLDGYCSDLTRTVSVGQPSPDAGQTPCGGSRSAIGGHCGRQTWESDDRCGRRRPPGARRAWIGRGVRAWYRSWTGARRPRRTSRFKAAVRCPTGAARGGNGLHHRARCVSAWFWRCPD